MYELSIPVNFSLVDYFNFLTDEDIHYNKNAVDHTWYLDNGGNIRVTAYKDRKNCDLYYHCPISYLTDYLDEEGIKYKIYDDDKVEICV